MKKSFLKNIGVPFKNRIDCIYGGSCDKLNGYLTSIHAFAVASYKSVYVIDYKTQTFEYVSNNPLLLCGLTAKEVLNMGYSFYTKYISEKDLDMLLKVKQLSLDFYNKIPTEDKLNWSMTCDFNLKVSENKVTLINHKIVPLFLNRKGQIWKILCLVGLSSNSHSGNPKFCKHDSTMFYKLDIEREYWIKEVKSKLNEREKEILILSAKGYTEKEISETLFISTSTVKFHKSNLIEKLEVFNIIEAIQYSKNNKLI